MRIAFVGRAQSGKDYAADYLTEHYGFTRVAFADMLKVGVAMTLRGVHGSEPIEDVLYADNSEHVAWTDARKGIPAMRAFLQAYGVAVREIVDPYYWVKQVLEKIDENPDANYVLTDCRFMNEAEALHDAGFTLVRVVADSQGGLQGSAAEHVSETEQACIPTDYQLTNPGDAAYVDHIDSMVADLLEMSGLQLPITQAELVAAG